MCDPITLTIAATTVAAMGQGFSALQQSAAAKQRAQIAEQNVALSNEAARTEQDNTRQEALRHYRRVAELKGQQRVAQAAGGIDVDFGNAADVRADTEMLAREDAANIYEQGFQRSRGFEIEASNFGAEAAGARSAAKGAIVGGLFDIAGTSLGGAQQFSKLQGQMPKPKLSYDYGGF